MADILAVRATKDGPALSWTFVNADAHPGVNIRLFSEPHTAINDGDVWEAEFVNKEKGRGASRSVITVRLVTKLQELKPWERLTELTDHWVDSTTLRTILVWLHNRRNVMLIGPKGSGKTSLPAAIATTLGWQDPCKVDVYTIRHTVDLFGSEGAVEGSTIFRPSAFLDYIERAVIAYEHGRDTFFLVVLDEINRAHAKMNETLHGLLDHTRQVTVTTSQRARTIKLPPNLLVMATMNTGAAYQGIFQLDAALKDRFLPAHIGYMPYDTEVRLLSQRGQIAESTAAKIVDVARALRTAEQAGHITFAPSFRACLGVADLARHGMPLSIALPAGLMQWCEGGQLIDGKFVAVAGSEFSKAIAAARLKGIGNGEVAEIGEVA